MATLWLRSATVRNLVVCGATHLYPGKTTEIIRDLSMCPGRTDCLPPTEGPLPGSLPLPVRRGVVSPLMQMMRPERIRASSDAEEERPRGRGGGDWSADGAPRHVCGPDLINSNVTAVSVPLAPLRNVTVLWHALLALSGAVSVPGSREQVAGGQASTQHHLWT